MKANNNKKQIKIPTKRTINLAANLEQKTNIFIAIPAIILIIVAAAIVSKFFVVDRYAKLHAAQSEVAYMQGQVDLLNNEYSKMGEIADLYAHYTYSGLTEEELTYFNREAVVSLVDMEIMKDVTVGNWRLQGNVLSIPMQAPTLETIKNVVNKMESQDLVEFCLVNNAITTDATDESPEYVTANLTIYLKNIEGGNY